MAMRTKTGRGTWLVGVAILVLAGAGNLDAGIVTVTYSGTVTGIYARDRFGSDTSASFEDFLPFGVGDPCSGVFEYDLSAVDGDPSADSGSYDAVSYGINIGGFIFGLGTPWIQIRNDVSGQDEADVTGDPSSVILPPGWQVVFASGSLAWNVGTYLTDSDGDVFDSDALPSVPDWADFDGQLLSFIAVSAIGATSSEMTWFTPDGSFMGRYTGIEITIDSFATVPEPTSATCMISLLVFGLAARCRRKLRSKGDRHVFRP